MFKFRAQYLPMLWPFVARNHIRYYLNGINVRPWGKGVLLAATDGHTMGLVFDTEGHADGEYTVSITPALVSAANRPRFPFSNQRGWKGAAFVHGIKDVADGKMRCRLALHIGQQGQGKFTDENAPAEQAKIGISTELHLQDGNALIDGKFPDVRRVIPARENIKPGAPDGYQVRYFDRLPKFRPGCRSGWGIGVRFYHSGENTALVCHLPEMPEFMALIMPWRDDHARSWQDGRPEWLDLPDAPKAAT